MELADHGLAVVGIQQTQEHVGFDAVLSYRSAEQGNDIHAFRSQGCGFVQNHAIRMWHPVQIVAHLPFGRSGGRTGLVKDTLGRPHIVGVRVDVDVIFSDLGMRFGAEYVGVDIGEVAHVQEVLDCTGRGYMHADGARVNIAAIGLGELGDSEQCIRRRTQADPDIQVLDKHRQRGGVSIGR